MTDQTGERLILDPPNEPLEEFTYLSFGAGVQSTALLIMSNLGLYDCPRADVAIFADTGDEPEWVGETLRRMKAWSQIPVEVVSIGRLSDAILKPGTQRKPALPVFTLGRDGKAAPLIRQCTMEYKIQPIHRRVRELCGYKPRQRVKTIVQALMGISVDEADRMTLSRTPWQSNIYPLVDARLNRGDCDRITRGQGFPAPGRSACVYCPYHSDRYWQMLRDEHPKEWSRAVCFDFNLRGSLAGPAYPKAGPAYLHRSLVPLDQVRFRNENQPSLWSEECAGVCGV